MTVTDTTSGSLATRPLPGQATAALVVGGIYLGLTVIGFFQVMAVMSELPSRYHNVLWFAFLIAAAVGVLLAVGMAQVVRRRSTVPMKVAGWVILVMGVLSFFSTPGLARVVDIAAGVALVCLLGSQGVKDFFHR